MTLAQRTRSRHGNMALFCRFLCYLVVAVMLSASGAAVDGATSAGPTPSPSVVRAGQLLAASLHMRDQRFAETVILLVHHDDSGAMGLIINRPISVLSAPKLLQRMLGEDAPGEGGREIRIHYGGPVQHRHWNFVHSKDYKDGGTKVVTDQVSLTGSDDILRALAKGKGPARGFLTIGYAGWGPGQLENEIQRKDWVVILPDDQIVFDDDMRTKWQRAMDKQGIEL